MRDGRVAAVGTPAAVRAAHPDLPAEDLGDALLAPGFVDAHCHLEWALTAGVATGGEPGFGRWLGRFLRAMAVADSPGAHGPAALWGALTALRAGTTTLCDTGPTGAAAGALARTGQRGVVCVEAFGQGDAAASAARAAEVRERVLAVEAGAGPRVRVGVSPHAPYTAGPALWAALAADADLAGRPWSTHLAESGDERPAIEAGRGPIADAMAAMDRRPARWPGPPGAAPVARLAAAGVLRPGLVAAHCVVLGDGDAGALAALGVRVAHCPVSNARLGCGTAPLWRLREAGVVVGLGTDSPASAWAYDLRAEARAAQLVHGAAGAPPSAEALVRMATLDGARALGMEAEIGSLETGRRADLVAVRPGAALMGGDPHEALLHAGSAVSDVWVDGERLLRHGEPVHLDAVAVAAGAAEARASLC